MKCWKCNRDGVIYRRFEGKAWCGKHFSEQFEKKVKKTIRKNNLIEKGDQICVALSGGKDSSLTLYLLNKILKDWRSVKLKALSINEGIKNYREESLENAKNLSSKLGIEHRIESFKDHFGFSLDEIVEKKVDKTACTYCGVFRRWLLNKSSRKMKCNKLAMGLNLDDEIQSVFMNYLQGDLNRLVRMGSKPSIVKNELFTERIKILRNSPEKECGLYCYLNDIDIQEDECPYVRESLRFKIRNFLNELEESSPGIKFSALNTFDAILPTLKKVFKDRGGKIKKCTNCGELTNRKVCKACELAENLGIEITS